MVNLRLHINSRNGFRKDFEKALFYSYIGLITLCGTKMMTKNTKPQKPQQTQKSVFVQNRKKKEIEIFVFCVITFKPIISKTC